MDEKTRKQKLAGQLIVGAMGLGMIFMLQTPSEGSDEAIANLFSIALFFLAAGGIALIERVYQGGEIRMKNPHTEALKKAKAEKEAQEEEEEEEEEGEEEQDAKH